MLRVRPRVRALRHAAPATLWQLLTDPVPDGTRRADATSGRRRGTVHRPTPARRSAGSRALRPRPRSAPGSRCSTCEDAVPIVHTAPTERPVLLVGRRGRHRRRRGRRHHRRTLPRARDGCPRRRRNDARSLRRDADLVLTDSNRRRNQQFFVGVRDNNGYTERAGQDSSTRTSSASTRSPAPTTPTAPSSSSAAAPSTPPGTRSPADRPMKRRRRRSPDRVAGRAATRSVNSS